MLSENILTVQSTYRQPCHLASDLKQLLKQFCKSFKYKKRRNKRLYNNLCAFFNYYNLLGSIQDGIGAPVHLASKSIRRFLGREYRLIIQMLKEWGILDTDDKYVMPKAVILEILYKKLGKLTDPIEQACISAEIESIIEDEDYESSCKAYILNKAFLGSDWELFYVDVKKGLDQPMEAPKDRVSKYIANVISKMTISLDRAQKELSDYTTKFLHLKDNKVMFGVKKKYFKKIIVDYGNNLDTIYEKSRAYIEKSFTGEFIKNNKTYYYIKREDFEQMKTKNVEFSYTHSLLMLHQKKIFSKREYKTIELEDGTLQERAIRSHHNISNFPTIFRKLIRIYRRGMKNLDIANSQFMFLTHTLNNLHLDNRLSKFAKGYDLSSDKSQLFFHLTREGILYDYIAREMNISRGKAKHLCFLILFDRVRDNEDTRLFKELFGEIYDFLCEFKIEFGYAALSQELQYIEASIMIEDVFVNDIMPQNFLCIPIHDSFFCYDKHFDKMKKAVISKLNKIIGKGNYKIREEAY